MLLLLHSYSEANHGPVMDLVHHRRNEEGGDSSETLKADMFRSSCVFFFLKENPTVVCIMPLPILPWR